MWRLLSAERVVVGADIAALEAFCALVARMRDARARVDREGLVVADAKGLPVRHPALDIELAASAECRAWVARRPDLFGARESTARPKGSRLDELSAKRVRRGAATSDPGGATGV